MTKGIQFMIRKLIITWLLLVIYLKHIKHHFEDHFRLKSLGITLEQVDY